MPTDAEKFGLPMREFLFTLDQVADMLSLQVETLKRTYLYFHGVHVGVPHPSKLQARNIDPQGSKPEWRIAEKELIRWLRYLGFRVYQHGSIGAG